MGQVAWPITDISDSGWTPTPVWNHVNAGGVTTGNDPQAAAFEVELRGLAWPASRQPGTHLLTVRMQKTGPDLAYVAVTLLQGGQPVATREFQPGTSYQDQVVNLTQAEINAITNYNTLSARVTAGRPVVPCCPNGLPVALIATLSNLSGCACLDGQKVTLTWNAPSNSWQGDLKACGTNYHFTLWCPSGNTCAGMKLAISNIGSGDAGVISPDTGCSCDTPSFTFQGFSGVTGCSGTFKVVVTAPPSP